MNLCKEVNIYKLKIFINKYKLIKVMAYYRIKCSIAPCLNSFKMHRRIASCQWPWNSIIILSFFLQDVEIFYHTCAALVKIEDEIFCYNDAVI